MMLHSWHVFLPRLPSPPLPSRSPSSFLCPTASTPSTSKFPIITNASSSSSSSSSSSATPRVQDAEEDPERFQRVNMETAGAYRLIDRRTGDQVIVWGDAHQPPSSHLLSAPPPPPTAPPPPPTVATGFARLKAHKVKSLMMRKTHQKSQVKSGRVNKPSHPITEDATLNSNDHQQQQQNEYQLSFSDDDEHEDEDDFYNDSPIINNTRSNSSSSGGAAAAAKERGAAASLRGWGGVSSADYSSSYSYSYDRKKLPRKSFAGDRAGFFSKTSFKNLGCSQLMITTLRSLTFLRPSHIQAMAFRPVLQGKSCIIADQSGSGKTLAYLCPIVDCLRQDEQTALAQGKPPNSEHTSGCPRVIVLAPTAELASQVLNNCRSISKSGIPFRSMVATGGFKQRTQLETLEQGLDVLIATPGRFLYLYQQGFVQLSHLQCVVLDEVDVLYGDEDFEQVLQTLITTAPVSVQYLFVTATLPLEIYNKVVEVFPDCEVIMGPGMHRTSSALEEVLVDCSGDPNEEKNPETAFENKKNALLKLVQESPVSKTIVFCNKIDTCRKVENVLKRVDRKEVRIRVLPFHAALAQEARLANLKEFLKSQSADSMFLVCTDRASRGIDFKEVDHVVLFDFPREPSEYVRRVGRTARGAGGAGKAYVFAVGKQVSLAGRIIERNRKGHPLHDVPGAYELDR